MVFRASPRIASVAPTLVKADPYEMTGKIKSYGATTVSARHESN